MSVNAKKTSSIIILTLILSALLGVFMRQTRLGETIHWKAYEQLLKVEMGFGSMPRQINDIVLVTIGNQTLQRVGKRWPFKRSYFAQAIDNLNKAGAKVIAFDFVFLGESSPEEDARLKAAVENAKVVMASAINENGMVELFSLPDLTTNVPTGFTTKLQDRDGATRRNLTYLVSERQPTTGLLSWEMQILKSVKDVDLATLRTVKSLVCFNNRRGERWRVPVDPNTNSFLIHFRAHTVSFAGIPFYQVLDNTFDPRMVRDKIVLIGTASTLLGDMHLTPIGWLPGITLNANAFLNLYARDFIRPVPYPAQWLLLILGIALSAFCVSRLRDFAGNLFIFLELIVFFVLSYFLLALGYIWNYSLFPVLASLCPLWARRLYQMMNKGSVVIAKRRRR